jgi:two-component system phosphate regulon sensor histidine kinase PhoR
MKRSLSPNRIAIYTGIASSLISLIIVYITFLLFGIVIPIALYILAFIIITLCTVALYRYAIIRFIHNKLKIIYKTIGKPIKYQRELQNRNTGLMQLVERDVAEWAINKNKQIRELRKLETYRKEFVGNVSHELKTPIFNAQGYIESLLDGGLEDEKINKDYLQKAAINLDRLEAIVTDLLSISKFEAGQIVLQKEYFDIIELVKMVIIQYHHLKTEFKSKIVVDEKLRPLAVYADQHRIQQVLENLISNAIKYGKPEYGKINISFLDLDDQIIVEIQDDGPGIKEEDIPRLFERFFRADKSRNRKIGGTGLGLSIVKNIIEAHHQTIHVQSEIGVGTTFSFSLNKLSDEELKEDSEQLG